jgi:mono/diheme cytochrome c family protein
MRFTRFTIAVIGCSNGRVHVINHGVQVRWAFILLFLLCVTSAASARQASTFGLTSGEAIYRAGCAGCHGPDGKGAPDTTVGFDKPPTFPDFSDCPGTTPELDVDWKATIRQGGRGRGFSRIMPAFEEQLTDAQIDAVIGYLRTLCRDSGWPRGELNLPRPLTTEKAFPEDETVVTTAVDAHHAPDVSNELVYEHRLSARTQFELSIPFGSVHDESGTLARGVGDVGLGVKRVLLASTHSILSAQGEMIMPTGNKTKGLGSGVTVFEAFAAYGQILPSRMFVQAQLGTEQPTSTEETPRTIFSRAALGTSFRQEAGIGRMWSPMFELITDRDLEDGARTNVDIMPQVQVTINRRQHIRGSVGLQVPVANTTGRSKQIVFYLLWDWFDGGLLDGWR